VNLQDGYICACGGEECTGEDRAGATAESNNRVQKAYLAAIGLTRKEFVTLARMCIDEAAGMHEGDRVRAIEYELDHFECNL